MAPDARPEGQTTGAFTTHLHVLPALRIQPHDDLQILTRTRIRRPVLAADQRVRIPLWCLQRVSVRARRPSRAPLAHLALLPALALDALRPSGSWRTRRPHCSVCTRLARCSVSSVLTVPAWYPGRPLLPPLALDTAWAGDRYGHLRPIRQVCDGVRGVRRDRR